jgi:hypothetical protein
MENIEFRATTQDFFHVRVAFPGFGLQPANVPHCRRAGSLR